MPSLSDYGKIARQASGGCSSFKGTVEEIKLKAQRKAGHFLEKLEKDRYKGGPVKASSQAAKPLSPYKQACEDAGIGKDDYYFE